MKVRTETPRADGLHSALQMPGKPSWLWRLYSNTQTPPAPRPPRPEGTTFLTRSSLAAEDSWREGQGQGWSWWWRRRKAVSRFPGWASRHPPAHPAPSLQSQRSYEWEVHTQHPRPQSSFRLALLSRASCLFTGLGEARASAYPHKACWKPALAVSDPAPPPLSVGGIHYFDDVPGVEAQFLVIHGDMVPECFSTDHTAIADELWREPGRAGHGGEGVPALCPPPLGRGDPDSWYRGADGGSL